MRRRPSRVAVVVMLLVVLGAAAAYTVYRPGSTVTGFTVTMASPASAATQGLVWDAVLDASPWYEREGVVFHDYQFTVKTTGDCEPIRAAVEGLGVGDVGACGPQVPRDCSIGTGRRAHRGRLC